MGTGPSTGTTVPPFEVPTYVKDTSSGPKPPVVATAPAADTASVPGVKRCAIAPSGTGAYYRHRRLRACQPPFGHFRRGARPVPPPHAASIPHLRTDRAATRRGAEPHPPCLRPHALIGAGECVVALYGVERRPCRVSPPPPSPLLGLGEHAHHARRHRGQIKRGQAASPDRPDGSTDTSSWLDGHG